ncbi:MAG: hypothetical protein ABI091_20270 [Ferruginibacter sp.]
MTWKTIISFTDKNTPYRYNVATTKSQAQAGENGDAWFNVKVSELDVKDNIVNIFNFLYNIKDDRFTPGNTHEPILLISEQMAELVREGTEKW